MVLVLLTCNLQPLHDKCNRAPIPTLDKLVIMAFFVRYIHEDIYRVPEVRVPLYHVLLVKDMIHWDL